MNLRGASLLIFGLLVLNSLRATVPIGCGLAGLKVTGDEKERIIFRWEDNSYVGDGEFGGFQKKAIEVIYGGRKAQLGNTRQLYPIDENTAFTCDFGASHFITAANGRISEQWDCEPRVFAIYHLKDGSLTTDSDMNAVKKELKLAANEVLLGHMDEITFFWRDFDKSQIFWRRDGTNEAHTVRMPRKTVDIYGVTRGIKKKYAVLTFAKWPWLYPYGDEFIEFDLAK